MRTITLRVPEDLKQRLQAMAESRGESLNHFIESIAVQALVAEETGRTPDVAQLEDEMLGFITTLRVDMRSLHEGVA